jgi:arylsulfatase A-like enzyme
MSSGFFSYGALWSSKPEYKEVSREEEAIISPLPSRVSVTKFEVEGGLSTSIKTRPLSWLVIAVIALSVITLSIISVVKSTSEYTSYVDDDYNQFGSKPHIIIFLADDMGWNSVGYENYDLDFATPILDDLASDGIIFNQFYAQEVCTPARGSLLTGRYPLTIGMQFSMVQTAIPWGLDYNETTIAEVLQADGYTTHMFGKWHLGHYSPRMLPTARGFDTYTGYVNGESYYWSKRNPDHTHFKDMINSTSDCYDIYRADDIHTYSTFFYRDKAIEIIDNHDVSESMFLYMAWQAVHDPFTDVNVHQKGIPKEYVDADIYGQITSEVTGRKRRQYAMALNLMDSAIGDIMDALTDKGMIDNTVIIFASDNGGCYGAGGKNGPLRGTKGSLFEGGTKVDAFIWSPLIPDALRGSLYNNIFHISDWFPTILDMTGTSYTPQTGYELDGVSHLDSILYETDSPRTKMLYNYYYLVDRYNFKMDSNGSFAVRNEQYKLVHTFNSSIYAQWYEPETFLEDDDAITTETRCAASANTDGDFVYWLFDLYNDPYEEVNLWNNTDDETVVSVKTELYALLDEYAENAYHNSFDYWPNLYALKVWQDNWDYMTPYVKEDDLEYWKGTYPEKCFDSKSDAERRELYDALSGYNVMSEEEVQVEVQNIEKFDEINEFKQRNQRQFARYLSEKKPRSERLVIGNSTKV